MTKDDALKLALEALELQDYGQNTAVVEAIKEALAQQQEPVITKNEDGMTLHFGWDDLPIGTKLYTEAPKREWVGLTDDEKTAIYKSNYNVGYELIDRAEAKLKEKNT